jgi:hypothetical protein
MTGFKSFLSALGHGFVAVFGYLGSAKGQAAVQGAEAIALTVGTAVGVGPAVAGIEALINTGLKEVIKIEASAAALGVQSGTGAQKAAVVIATIAPQASDFLVSIGVANPTAEQVQTVASAISGGLVAILNSLPSPTTPAA